jgi:hypothetical protein
MIMHATINGPWTGVRLALLLILLSWFFFYYYFYFYFYRVSWSFVLCFVFPSLEFSVAGWRSVNLTLPFLNRENGDFSILMRDITLYEWSSFRSKLGGRQIKVNHAWGKFFFIWLSRSKGRNMEVLQWNIGIHLLKHTSQVYFPHLP